MSICFDLLMYQVKSVSTLRVLVLYTRTLNPSQKLVDLTTYIIQVYGPTWFRIKGRTDDSFLRLQLIKFRFQIFILYSQMWIWFLILVKIILIVNTGLNLSHIMNKLSYCILYQTHFISSRPEQLYYSNHPLTFHQCCGSGSVWIHFIWLDPFQTIRIQVAPKTNQNHVI